MKLTFISDTFFYNYNNKIYPKGSINENVINRYKQVFDEIEILSRQIKIKEDITNLTNLNILEGIKFIDIPNFTSIKNFYKLPNIRKIIKRVIKNSEIIIARLPSILGNIAIDYAKKYKKPYGVEVVGCPWDALWNYGNIQGKILAPFAYLRTKKIAKNSKFTLYVTEQFLQKRYPTKGYSKGCSDVFLPIIEEKVLINRIEKIKKMDLDKKIKIGMIGALTSQYKGFDLAIKSIKELNNKYNNIELHILGGGDASKWRKLAKKEKILDKVFFDGTLPSGYPVFEWIDNIDIFIQPSKQEGLPRALLEAMSRGCPAVGSKTGGIPELLDERLIHKKGNYKDLTKKIIFLISNKEIMIEQAKKNFETSKNYSKDVLDEKRTGFWKEFRKYVESEKS